ncbi:hypothetical protein CR513_12950, partial [Mucuna pruriens]
MKNLGGLKYFIGIKVARSNFLTLLLFKIIIWESTQTRNQLIRRDIKDIACAVRVVSQFMHCLGEDHTNATIQIIRYLKSALRNRLMFSKNNHLDRPMQIGQLSVTNRISTSSYFTFVRRNLVMWRSKK